LTSGRLTSNGFDSWMPITGQAQLANKAGTRVLIDHEATVSLARNEVGVFEFPGGGRYAVAVFTRQEGRDLVLHDASASAVIGTIAQLAVDYLRTAAGHQLSDRNSRTI